MKHCIIRDQIDEVLMTDIERALVCYGVPKEKADEAYAAIRYQVEARAVLLNRVQDRKMPTAGINYYGQYLEKVARIVGVTYDPYQPL